MNGCLAKYWEGMLISYLTTQDTYLPFTELEDLYYKTDYKVVVLPKSAYMQSFQIGNDLEKAIWKERIEPYMKAFPVVSRCLFSIYNLKCYTINFFINRQDVNYQNLS